MADYIPITEAQSDPEAAVDSSIIKRLRDNPLAIIEGSAGAPRIADFGFRGQGLSFTLTDLDDFGGILIFHYGFGYELEYSTDNGSSFSSTFTVAPTVQEVIADFTLYDFAEGIATSSTGGNVTITGSSASVNAVRLTNPLATENTYFVLAQGGNAAL